MYKIYTKVQIFFNFFLLLAPKKIFTFYGIDVKMIVGAKGDFHPDSVILFRRIYYGKNEKVHGR